MTFPRKRPSWTQVVAVVLLLLSLAAVVILFIACPCGCSNEFLSPHRIFDVSTSQPVDFSEDLAAVKAQLSAQTSLNAKMLDVHNANSCDYWDQRLRTGLIFALVGVCCWALYRITPGGASNAGRIA